jgi:hypothetical protein
MLEVPEVGSNTLDMSLMLKCYQQATYEAVIAALEEMRNLADLASRGRPIDREQCAPLLLTTLPPLISPKSPSPPTPDDPPSHRAHRGSLQRRRGLSLLGTSQ